MNPDPRRVFLWPSYQEALERIELGLRQGVGLMSLVGQRGAGKTTLLRHVLSSVGPDERVAAILGGKQPAGEIFHSILQDLGVPFQGGTVKGAAEALQKTLIDAAGGSEKVAILVDNAEELKTFVLEMLLRLANIEVDGRRPMTLVLAGGPRLAELLDRPSLELAPLSLDQARAYLKHRLSQTGGSGSELDEGAIRRVHQLARGLPGRMDTLCEEGMALAAERGHKQVSESLIGVSAFARSASEAAQPGTGLVRATPGRRARSGVLIPVMLGAITGAIILFWPGSKGRGASPPGATASPFATTTPTSNTTAATPLTSATMVAPAAAALSPTTPGSGRPREAASRSSVPGARSVVGKQPGNSSGPRAGSSSGSAEGRGSEAGRGRRGGTGSARATEFTALHSDAKPGAADPEFRNLVKEWTTRPEFSSPLVDFLPLKKGIPTPKDVLGRHVGAPDRLTTTTEAYAYYRALEKASPRVKVLVIGKTDEGREQLIVNISSEQTIQDLEVYRGYLGQIADPRRVTEARMRDIIGKAKPMYYVSGGQHSPETGPPEMLMELAYRLVADDSPMYQAIRDNVIVAINPVVEPDGRDRMVDWYRRHKVDETDERTASPGPPYWGKYVFNDNNRDINYSQITTLNVLDWYLQWHPQVMHDLHESAPFLYTFSGQAPQNPSLDPILYSELPWFSSYEKSQMAKFGMPGVWDFGSVDMWSPGPLAFMSSNHNGMIRMYETFGNGGATTMKRKIEGASGGPDQTTREWYRPWPPYKEVVWSMRNNTNYMETGVLSALELTSKFPKVVLENFYKKSLNSIESGRKDAPYGYVIPGGQKDPLRVAMLVNLLRTQGIEVGKATTEVSVREGKFPAGSYVVKRDQPYGRLAKTLLEKQNFPDASLRTYDDTGWTMGLMMHAEVREIADLAILQAAVEPVNRVRPLGKASGSGRYLAVLNHGANTMATLRYKLSFLPARANETPLTLGTTLVPAGSLWFDTEDVNGADLGDLVETLGLTAVAAGAQPSVPFHDVDLPRLAVYSTWGNTQEVGWIRHAFDYFEIPFTLIYKEQVRAGNLNQDYDVILIPNQSRTSKGLVFDIPNKGKPLPYKQDPQFPTLGEYGESDDITGGMGLQGARELDKFVNAGGSLVTLAASSYFPPDFGLARLIDARAPSAAFYAPGPIIEAEITAPLNPIFYGYSNRTIAVRYGNGPLLNVPEIMKDRILMKYPGGDKSVLSGLFKSASEIRDRPAIVDLPQGRGQIVLFTSNPCYRWQNHGEFGMLFNTILHWNDLLSHKAGP